MAKDSKKHKRTATNPADTWKYEPVIPGDFETSNIVPDKRNPKKAKCELKRNIRCVAYDSCHHLKCNLFRKWKPSKANTKIKQQACSINCGHTCGSIELAHKEECRKQLADVSFVTFENYKCNSNPPGIRNRGSELFVCFFKRSRPLSAE